jgi:hypothetical protein
VSRCSELSYERSLLELATELGNVSKACWVMGYSRQQFYEIRRNFQTFGAEGLLDRIAGARAPHPNGSPLLERALTNLEKTLGREHDRVAINLDST